MKRLAQITVFGIVLIAQLAPSNAGNGVTQFDSKLADRIGAVWYRSVEQNLTQVPVGAVCLRFTLSASGKVLSTEVVSNTSNQLAAELAVDAVQCAKLLPVPKRLLRDGVFRREYTFRVFPTP